MPKSRGRRQQKPSRSRSGRRRESRRDLSARARAEYPILHATDAAENRGDARAALELIERDLQGRGDDHFWRPDRIQRLMQLATWGPMLPRWATSRWILAQAAQWLDPRGRDRTRKAIEIALTTRGDDVVAGSADLDVSVNVIDHDWVFRQVFLYELGRLQDFIARAASSDLLVGADRIQDWARTPMGGYRLVRESSQSLSWLDLAAGENLEALNIGAASLLQPGECAIGRLVPIEGGAMFESSPLFVPDDVARDVADDPDSWITALAAACRRSREAGEQIETASGHSFRLLSDVPDFVQKVVALAAVEHTGRRPAEINNVADVDAVEVGLIHAALDQRLSDGEFPVEPWPSVAATMLDPHVLRPLRQSLRVSDGPQLLRLADLLAGPAGELCRALAGDLESAA